MYFRFTSAIGGLMEAKWLAVIMIFWAGMVTAISFMESWVKFRTPTLEKSIGLDVGRTVFGFFNKIQVAFVALMLLLAWLAGVSFNLWLIICCITIIVVCQNFWLFPILASRVDIFLKGEKPRPSSVHAIYGILELAKLLLLIVTGICFLYL